VHGGQLEIRFFARKISEVEPIGLHFGPLMGGLGPHSHNFFRLCKILVTRKKVDFRRNFRNFFCGSGPRYSCQNFIPDGPWESPFSALEKLAPTPKIFAKFGENFFGGGPPRGAWGQNIRGRLQMRRGSH